jgi:hypothetical protein
VTRRDLVAVAAATVLFLASYLPHLAHSTDDAFITYRCAWNAARGARLVFNPGETHLATTAPGFALILAAPAAVFGPRLIPIAGGLLGLFSLAGSAWLLATRFAPAGWPVLPIVLVLLASSRWLVEVLGHETALQAFLLIAGVASLDRDRQVAGGVLFALATAVRPDAGVLAGLAGLHHWIVTRRLPIRLAVAYAIPLAIFAGVILAAAGTLLPASVAVKQAEASVPALALERTYWKSLAGWFERDYGGGAIALLLVAIAGLVQGLRSCPSSFRRLVIVAAAAIAFYPVAGVTFAPWYFVLPLTTICFLAAIPLARAIHERRAAPAAIATLALVVAHGSSASWIVENGAAPPDPRMRPNRRVAEWIRAGSGPEDSLAAVEIGFLAYFADRPVLDLVGLGSPGALDALLSGRIADYFFEHRPTFLVRHPVFDYLQGPILADPRFAETYRLEREFVESEDEPVIGVFRRIDEP